MKKLLIVILTSLTLTGCFQSAGRGNAGVGADNISELCLDGVAYYFYAKYYRSAMAVRLDPITHLPVSCK